MCRIIFMKASTAPTITKLFQRQPRRIKCAASRRDGFSQNRLTSEIKLPDPPGREDPGSIHP